MAFYQFQREQLIDASLANVWDFISSPQNLKKITPPSMGFDICTPNLPNTIYEGMIIRYTVKPFLAIPLTWVTEITHVRDQYYFVDEQRVGPYTLWHHQHFLLSTENGVLMKDIVSYQPPFAFLGIIANALFIKNKLNKIFDFRAQAMKKIFPS